MPRFLARAHTMSLIVGILEGMAVLQGELRLLCNWLLELLESK